MTNERKYKKYKSRTSEYRKEYYQYHKERLTSYQKKYYNEKGQYSNKKKYKKDNNIIKPSITYGKILVIFD